MHGVSWQLACSKLDIDCLVEFEEVLPEHFSGFKYFGRTLHQMDKQFFFLNILEELHTKWVNNFSKPNFDV